MFRKLIDTLGISLVVICLGAVALGQGTTVSILGTVYDQSQAVLPGVTVTATDVDTGQTRSALTDDEGRYTMPQMRIGHYQVEADLPGFQAATREVTLTLGGSAVIDFTLTVGGAATELFVTSEAPLVDTSSSSLVGLVDDQQIRALPLNGRSFTDLATIQTGVFVRYDQSNTQIGNEGIKLSIAGTRTTQQAFLLDGTDIRNQMQTTPGSLAGVLLGVDTVQEFNVVTGLANAEYGAFTGGVINAVTRSGTNELHGSVFHFHRNSALDARNFFDRDPGNPLQRSDPPNFVRNQYGFTLGGPIVKDKLFFFGSFEGLNDRLTTTTFGEVPSLNARNGIFADGTTVTPDPARRPIIDLYPQPNGDVRGDVADYVFPNPRKTNEYYYMIKIDWQVNDKDSISGRYTLDDADRTAFLGNVGGGFDQIVDDSRTRSQFSLLEWKRLFSPQVINEARVSYNRSFNGDNPVFLANFPDLMHFNQKLFTFTEDPWYGVIGAPGLTNLGFLFVFGKINHLNRFQYIDNLSITSGAHSIKLGANIHRIQFNYDAPIFAPGFYNFASIKGLVGGANMPGPTGRPLLFLGTITGRLPRGMRQWITGFYAQDDWRIGPNFTMNLGLRYEPYSRVSEVNEKISQFRHPSDTFFTVENPLFTVNPSYKNFAPRVGFAWDPFKDGKTSIRGGYGLFYELIQPIHYFSNINVNPPFAIRILRVPFPPFPDPTEGFPPEPCTQQGNIATCVIPTSPWSLSDEIEQGGVHQYQLSIQRELAQNLVVQVGYKGSYGYNLGHMVDRNFAIPQTDANGVFPYWPTTLNATGQLVGPPRRNSAFAQQRDMAWDANSWYNALEISARKRFRQGYSFQVSYTYSKGLDEASSTTVFDDGGTPNGSSLFPEDLSFDKGNAAFDVRNRLVINGSLDVPLGQGYRVGGNWSGALQHILGGWTINGILTASDGAHLNFLLQNGDNRSFSGQTNDTADRPNLIPGGNNNPVLKDGRDPNRYYDVSQFTIGPAGYLTNLARNTLEGPGVLTFDFSLSKNIHFTEERYLQFRAEFFNITNRANFGRPEGRPFLTTPRVPDPTPIVNPNAGRITVTTTSARQVQFALKIIF